MDLRERRELNNGFGDALARAFELAVTPAIFGGLGYAADRAFGTTPILMIGFLVFALVGVFVKMWFAYDRDMRSRETDAVWGRR